jgi:hypothetical protein
MPTLSYLANASHLVFFGINNATVVKGSVLKTWCLLLPPGAGQG